MAETITIPSPTVFLSSPSLKPVKALPKTSPRRPPPATKAAARAQSTTTANGVTKRKQSKSRNGCITCKAKRLKCDETKPTCQQCARRSVACGGYKKDFKWRPFEEASFVGKPTVGKPKKATPPPHPEEIPEPARPASPALSDSSNVTIGNSRMLPEGLVPMPSASSAPAFVDAPFETVGELYPSPTQDAIPFMLPPDQMPLDAPFDPDSAPSTICVFDDRDAEDTLRSATTAPSSLSSDQSPRLVDLLLPPAPDADPTSPEYLAWRAQYPDPIYQPVPFDPAMESMPLPMDAMEEDDVEEIVREPVVLNPDHEAWVMRLPSPSPTSSSSSGSSDSSHFFSAFLREPIFDASSPEMLTRRYDRETCGILSVKDGPTENPWRTLVWPLARDCPALYHAIASMTCFHSSRSQPNLRIHGIDHMRTAVHTLAGGLQNMRIDAAIATTLVLAFAESWDQHTSTGINHIKGAKILINQALVRQRNVNTVSREELERLRFLCNTWIYMDVIARITSVDDDESNDFEIVSSLLSDPSDLETQLDPLMGCASTLFPIIGRTANLVRRVCRSPSSTGNSPATISQAMDLKQQLENWVPPAFFEQPEDPTSLVVHSLQTAEAYRWATLLYLHQAVPEIPSLPSAELAKKVMVYLATVPPSSRAVIVQIYPLTAAGCEALGEDRDWVCQRWDGMAARMGLGIIDRCKEVTREVWDRRDAWRAERAERERARRLGKRKESLSMAEVSAVAAAAAAAAAAASAAQESESGQSLGMDLGMGMQMPMVKSEAKSELGIDDEAFSAWMEATGFAASAAAAAAAASSKRRSMSGLMSESKRIKAEKKAKKEMGMGGGGMGMEVLEPEFTVRGRLHWIGVMKDWKWEVLLG